MNVRYEEEGPINVDEILAQKPLKKKGCCWKVALIIIIVILLAAVVAYFFRDELGLAPYIEGYIP